MEMGPDAKTVIHDDLFRIESRLEEISKYLPTLDERLVTIEKHLAELVEIMKGKQ